MSRLAEFIWQHSRFFLKYSAHILWIRVACQFRDLIQLQGRIDQKVLDPADPVISHRLREPPARFFLKL